MMTSYAQNVICMHLFSENKLFGCIFIQQVEALIPLFAASFTLPQAPQLPVIAQDSEQPEVGAGQALPATETLAVHACDMLV